MKIYGVSLNVVLKFRYAFLIASVLGLGGLYVAYKKLNWEFIPQINEGVVMYMPVTINGVSIDTALEYLKKAIALSSDWILSNKFLVKWGALTPAPMLPA